MNQSPTPQESSLGSLFAGAAKAIITLIVLVFLGIHTLNFFAWTFPDEQSIYRPLGFGLTGGAFIAYILIFKYAARTKLTQFVSLSMIIICGLGELAAAGFGMQVEAYKSAGISFTKQEIDLMIWAIRFLGGVHAVALVLDFIGDDIGTAWKQRGVPITNTVFDRRQESRTFPMDIPSPTTDGKQEFMSGQYDYCRPPNGDRQHPDLVFARLPSQAWETITREWQIHNNNQTQEAGETPSPFLKGQPE